MVEARQGRPARFEAQTRTQAGVIQDWDTVLTPVLDDHGHPEKILALSRDITEWRQAEALLRESEARRSFLLALGDLTRSMSDPAEVVAASTRALGEHLGVVRVTYTEIDEHADWATTRGGWTDGTAAHLPEEMHLSDFGEQLIGRLKLGTLRLDDVVTHDHTVDCLPALRALGIGALVSVPMFKVGRFVASLNVQQNLPRNWSDAEVELIEAVAERTWDAVERVRMQAALHRRERELQLLTDSLPVLISYVDAEGRYRFVNRAYESWFSLSRAELLGRRVADMIGEAAYDVVRPYMARALAGERLGFDQFMSHKSGQPRHVRVEYVPRTAPDGSTEGFYALIQDVTVAKEVEAALRRSEARLAAIFAEAPVGLSEIGLDGRFMSVNGELCAMLGRTREQVMSSGVPDVTHPDDIARSLENFHRTVATSQPVPIEKRYLRPNGMVVWANSNLTRLVGEDGEPRGVLAVTVDLSARHFQETALREETRMLETLNRAGAALAGELDLERLVQNVTDAAVELTGARFGAYFHNVMDETGERLHLYTLSGAERAAFEGMGRPRATAIFGPTFRNETIIRSDDILADPRYGLNAPHTGMPKGHLPVRSYLAIPVVSRSGEVLGGLIFGHPELGRFTERHERLTMGLAAQAAIAIDNARLFRALQAAREALEQRVEERTAERNRVWSMSRDLFAVMGFDGYLRAINPAWEATLGFDTETLLTRPFPEQVHPDDHPAVEKVITRLRRGETVARFEDRLRHIDGSWRWIAWTLVPEGDVFYAVGRDVTSEKEAAAELEQTQDALRQAQKMEAVGQLTGGIAHDFNNLLGAVVGSFDLIRRKADDVDRLRRYAEAGLQAAERGAKLTGQLLAFSRAQRIELKPLVVPALVMGMRDMLARTLGPMVRLGLSVEEGRAPVLSDSTQLEMAVLNLAINARDAMPDGGDLTIATALRPIGKDPQLRAGDYIELSVTDTGSGMRPDVVARAFDPFFTTKGVGKGTGLGLSQVYGIARQAGGTVRIESRVGSGTTVRILMPCTDLPLRSDAEPAGSPVLDVGVATVLVVDDDPDMRRVLGDSLETLGYRVLEASDGPSGLAALDKHSPDLLMVDFAMPGMNGAEVAKAAWERRPHLPVVFASGYADTAAIEGVAGPDATVLRKPFRMDQLQAVLANALGGKP